MHFWPLLASFGVDLPGLCWQPAIVPGVCCSASLSHPPRILIGPKSRPSGSVVWMKKSICPSFFQGVLFSGIPITTKDDLFIFYLIICFTYNQCSIYLRSFSFLFIPFPDVAAACLFCLFPGSRKLLLHRVLLCLSHLSQVSRVQVCPSRCS